MFRPDRSCMPRLFARRGTLVVVLALGVLALAGCGASHSSAAGSGRSGRSAKPTGSLGAASPGATTVTSGLDPAKLAGKVLFGPADGAAACGAALDGTPPPGLPDPSGTSSASSSAVPSGTGTLIQGGLLILPCEPTTMSAPSTYIGFDLFKRAVTWQVNLAGYDVYQLGTGHLFLISHTTTPASGLQGPKTTYQLTAINLATGEKSWTVPFNADSASSGDNQIMGLDEGLSGVPGHPRAVVITYLGTSAYDAQTGASLWHIATEHDTGANGSYATDKITEIYGYQDNAYDSHITGFDTQTGRQLWDLRLPVPCAGGTVAGDDVYVGTVEWQFGSRCVEAHDLATGKVIIDQAYPDSWQNVTATPTQVLAFDGTRLSLFRISDFQHPIWSEPADSATPMAISSGHALVLAPSGELVLSTANGSITARLPSALNLGGRDLLAVDGLVAGGAGFDGTSVVELDQPLG